MRMTPDKCRVFFVLHKSTADEKKFKNDILITNSWWVDKGVKVSLYWHKYNLGDFCEQNVGKKRG